MLLGASRLAIGTLGAIPVPPPGFVDRQRAGVAMMLGRVAAAPLGAAALALLVVAVLMTHAVRPLGGVTGDAFGAAVELALVTLLVALS